MIVTTTWASSRWGPVGTKNSMKKFIFFIIWYQLFVQTLLGHAVGYIEPVRMAIDFGMYSLAAFLFLTKRLKLNYIHLFFVALAIITFAAFVTNPIELFPTTQRVRFTFLALSFYIVLSNIDLSGEDLAAIYKSLFIIGYLQLPVVTMQLALFDTGLLQNLPGAYVDAGTGTVGFKDSGVTGMYLTILVLLKLQEIISFGFRKTDVAKLLILAAPLGLINSDAQFVFLPLVLFALLFVNKMLSLKSVYLIISILVTTFVVDYLIQQNWDGQRGVYEIARVKVNQTFFGDVQIDQNARRLLRYPSMYVVVENMTDNSKLLFGNGPGYWLARDSEGGASSITNIWYHANTLLLTYGELGLFSVLLYLSFPIFMFWNSDNSFFGKVVKVLSVYLLLLFFYHHPLSRLSIIIPIFFLIFVYQKTGGSLYLREQTDYTVNPQRNKHVIYQ